MIAGTAIEVRDVSRAFGPVVALNEVSLRIESGVVGLLGPNGAGKSTLLKILSGELRPSAGAAEVLGEDPYANPAVFRRVGLCPEQDAVFDDVSAREFVSFLLRLRGLDSRASLRRAELWLDRVGLKDRAKESVSKFSGGMKRRLNLAIGLVHNPRVVLLDESANWPTRGPLANAAISAKPRARSPMRSAS